MKNDNGGRLGLWIGFGALALVAATLANLAVMNVTTQYDLTEDNRYTIHPAVARIAGGLKDHCKVTVWLSESLPGFLSHLPRCLRQCLIDMRRASPKDEHGESLLTFEFKDPKGDPDEMQRLHEQKIDPVSAADVQGGERKSGSYYLSLEFVYQTEREVMQLAELQADIYKEERTMASLPGFIATRLVKVTSPAAIVGIASEKKMPPQQGRQEPGDVLGFLRQRLATHCKVRDVVLKNGAAVPADIRTLVVYRPEAFAEADVFQLDQFVMGGGRVIVLYDSSSIYDVDRAQQIQGGFQKESFSPRTMNTGLGDWLANFGFHVTPGVVLEADAHAIVRQQLRPTLDPATHRPVGMPHVESVVLPGFVNVRDFDDNKKRTDQVNATEPAVAGVPAFTFLLPTPMLLDTAAEFHKRHPRAELRTLLTTSTEAWSDPEAKDPLPMHGLTPPPMEQRKRFVLAACAAGELRSAWATRDAPAGTGVDQTASRPHLTETGMGKPGQIWVFADSDFASDIWIQAMGQISPLAARGLQGAAAALVNSIDIASLGEDLVDIRRGLFIDRSIDAEAVKKDRDLILFVNVIMMAGGFILLAVVVWAVRKARTFVASPRPQPTVFSTAGGPPPLPPADPGANGGHAA